MATFVSTMITDLITQITTTIGKKKVEQLAEIAVENNIAVAQFINLTFHENEQIGFRAAWILERIYSNQPAAFAPDVPYFLNRFLDQHNLSARRHYAKILALMTKRKAPIEIKLQLENYTNDSLVETVFDWLVDEKVPVAIKSHCLNILANFIPKYPWIKDELIQTMDHLAGVESIAFFAKVKQIRKQLKIQ